MLELRFGLRITRLGARLERDGGAPSDVVPVRPSGRPDRGAADELFPRYRAAVEAAPDDWRAWYRLGVVYDAAGGPEARPRRDADRPRARTVTVRGRGQNAASTASSARVYRNV
ncbi:tetratricopeptide repeat protein [Curtobacterium sp. MCJR17_043]|uniref:tetratricopeptide repeat protein n=1 Tax=Curtobacterium sp. MCJR17_043 TaxID=2175660 RepID=UPI0032E87325